MGIKRPYTDRQKHSFIYEGGKQEGRRGVSGDEFVTWGSMSVLHKYFSPSPPYTQGEFVAPQQQHRKHQWKEESTIRRDIIIFI